MARPWMPLYVADYRADTAHLSTLQHGAYLLLIMHYWTTGALPNDDTQLARIAGLTPVEWRRMRAVIASLFSEGWKHKRIEEELEEAKLKYERRVAAGKKGGKASATGKQSSSNAIGNAQANDPAIVNQPQPQSQRDDEIYARAREPSISQEATDLAESLLFIVGFRDPKDATPDWYGIYQRAEMWLDRGWTRAMTDATARKIMEGRSDRPGPKYFEVAFANAFASLNAPVPEGKPTERAHATDGKSVHAAAARLVENLAKFNEPAPVFPDLPSEFDRTRELRGEAGGAPLRAISQR